MLLSPKSSRRQLCPFCFEYFRLADTPFRCSSHSSHCGLEPDPVYQKFWGDPRALGRVLPSAGRFVRMVRCSECNEDSRKRLCPNCHSELPHTTGDCRTFIFAVIGAKEAGKSHYLAILIDEIKKRVGPKLAMLLEPLNDETIKRYRREFWDPVFKDGRTIETTKPGLTERPRPLVYSLAISGKTILRRTKIRDVVVIVFFDTAGEDLNDEDVMATVNKYIFRSDGILLLIDPLQLNEVRKELGKSTALPMMNAETSDIVTRTTRLVQNGRNLKAKDVIDIPLAVAFFEV